MNQAHCLSFIEQPFPSKLNPKIQSLFGSLKQNSFALLESTPQPFQTTTSKRLAVCFSGGPAPGGHNVIVAIAKLCENHHNLFGVMGGFGGLIKGQLKPLTLTDCESYYNIGGFDLLKTDRTKLTKQAHYDAIKQVVKQHQLDAIIIIGGDDSQTNAIFLADALAELSCSVIGVPKTIDGDLRYPPYLPISFGFYSACDVYIELINNLIRDTQSIQKYWHFVKLMGRTSGHITHYVGTKTKADLFFLGEYLAKDSMTLSDLVKHIGDFILKSTHNKKPYGVICIPEGLLEWLPDIKQLINGLHLDPAIGDSAMAFSSLSATNKTILQQFPAYIQNQLLLERDAHGNIQLSRLETERLLIDLVKHYLAEQDPNFSFHGIPHFYGYEGRCTHPNSFDANFCTQLGHIAGSLALNGYTGYMAGIDPTHNPNQAYGIPIAQLLTHETRNNNTVVVVKKTTVLN
ncbi:diphosphate--fructose-6-phosphate 1-phosphotransferase [bacterium]|nr:diphosphate--fructose-6-phosphate 1-phosphotransferase [bacterium]